MNNMAGMAVLIAAGVIVLRGVMTGADSYGAFLTGAQRGMEGAMELFPALCAMMLMLSLLTSSGLMEAAARLLQPVTRLMNLPIETTPMLLLRPLTGSGSLSVLQEIFDLCGPDSRAGRVASVMMGSSETIVYTMTVYLSAAGVRRLPDALWVSLVSYLAGVMVCGLIV